MYKRQHEEVDVAMVIKTLQKNASNAQNMVKEVIKTFKNFSAEKDVLQRNKIKIQLTDIT